MHVEHESKVMLSLIQGFTCVDPAQIPLLQAKRRPFVVLRLIHDNLDANVQDIAGNPKKLDSAMANILDVVAGLDRPNTGVSVNLNNSVFWALRGNMTTAMSAELAKSNLEIENRRMKAEAEKAQMEIEKGKLEREREALIATCRATELEAAKERAAITYARLLHDTFAATFPDLSPQQVAQHIAKIVKTEKEMRERLGKAKPSEFENLLDGLA